MKKLIWSLSFLVAPLIYAGTKLIVPTNMPHGLNLPATCKTGDYFQKTNSGTGQQLYLCESTNTWVPQGGGSSGGLIPGSTNYIQNRDTLQVGSSYYVTKGTIEGDASAQSDGLFVTKTNANGVTWWMENTAAASTGNYLDWYWVLKGAFANELFGQARVTSTNVGIGSSASNFDLYVKGAGLTYNLLSLVGAARKVLINNGIIDVSTTTFNGVTYNWPIAQGAGNTYPKNDGSGNVSWVPITSVSSLTVSNLSPTAILFIDSNNVVSQDLANFTYNNTPGGSITIRSQNGLTTGTGGPGGDVYIKSGDANGDATVARTGGSIYLTPGASTGPTLAAGAVVIRTGAAGVNPIVGANPVSPSGGEFTVRTGTGGYTTGGTSRQKTGSGGAVNFITANGTDFTYVGSGTQFFPGQGGSFSMTLGRGGHVIAIGSSTADGGIGGGLNWAMGDGGISTMSTTGTGRGGSGGGWNMTFGNGAAGYTTGGIGGSLRWVMGSGATPIASTGSSVGGAGPDFQLLMGVGGASSPNAGCVNGTGGAGGTMLFNNAGNQGTGGNAITVVTGTNTAGAGATLGFFAGNGGRAINGAMGNYGGQGGTITFQAGIGGHGTTKAAAGGGIRFTVYTTTSNNSFVDAEKILNTSVVVFYSTITVGSAVTTPLITELQSIKWADGTVQVSSPPASVATAGIVGSTSVVGISIDGGGSAIVAGSTRSITVPYGCTVSSWTIISDQSGSIAVHISSSSFSDYPTLSNMSGFGNGPTLSTQQKNSSPPTSWNGTSLGQGSIVSFVVDSASTVTWVNIVLWLVRT